MYYLHCAMHNVHCQLYLSQPRLFTPETWLARKLGSSQIRGGCSCLKLRGAKSGHQRFSVGQKRSGRADGSWWLGYFGLEEAESVFCFSSLNGEARKWWKCFFRRCPGSPYQQSQQVRIHISVDFLKLLVECNKNPLTRQILDKEKCPD